MPILTREKKIIYKRKIKGFWEEYRRNKIGILGIIMLIAYITIAILAPYITPYDVELDKGLAENYAMPEWITYIVPQYRDLPRTHICQYNLTAENLSPNIKLVKDKKNFNIYYNGNETVVQNFTASTYNNPYEPYEEFTISFGISVQIYNVSTKMEPSVGPLPPKKEILSGLRIHGTLILVTPDNKEYVIYDYRQHKDRPVYNNLPEFHIDEKNYLYNPDVDVYTYTLNYSRPKVRKPSSLVLYELDYIENTGLSRSFVRKMFSKRGEYKLILSIKFEPIGKEPGNRSCKLTLFATDPLGKPYGLELKGKVFGLLGTDNIGADVFSQFLMGFRISLTIGLIAAVLTTTIGVTVGVIAGYIGGAVDEVLMRIVDILLCIPVLPILLILVAFFGPSVWYLILIVAIFWWLGLSRMIRSQVLSIREMPFIECAIASGASKPYIMFRHIIPNVLPLALADFVLTVPGAVMLEAALSFIGFGDPTTPTWGRMLNRAWTWGAFANEKWWTYVPPGLAIIFLCLTFVFIGHALDEVVNPRLRKRR